jgi:nicotinamide riboside transporter PnuC
MLASNTQVSPYGYIFFLLSSLCLLGWAFSEKHKNQLTMQAVFFLVNTYGIYNWLIA